MALQRKMDDNTLLLLDNGVPVFKMTESEDEGRVLLKLEGSLRSDVGHDFQDELAALAVVGAKLELDFSKVTYMSSSCTEVLLSIQQQIDRTGKGDLLLKAFPDAILQELIKTGVSELLMIED